MRAVVNMFAEIFRALWAHKMRSFLTMFGIAWGVGSLLLLVGLGEGFRSGNQKQLDALGENIIFLFGGRYPAIAGNQQSGKEYHLTYDDYLGIKAAPHIKAASPVLQRFDIRAVSETGSYNGQVIGVEPQFNGIRYLPMHQGRWLNDGDEEQRRNVVVVGTELVKVLFPGRPVIGNILLLNGVRFEIVGTLDPVGHGDNNATNSRIYVPYSTMSMYFPLKGEGNEKAVSIINFQPRTREEHLLARDEARAAVGRNHGFDWHDPDAFDDWDTVKSAETVGKIWDAMNGFLGSVGLVTLALGAIGVINIMLVSVTERTREIGLRKALGATNRSILFQFFLEGLFITAFSGAIGVAGAAGLMHALQGVQWPDGFDPPAIVPASAALALGSLTLAGIVAGLYPARKAALMTPVEALRQE
ncbi:MAG TPA: ABC transporter permease [Candidatus Acidoferrales bacterium]|nr:ABC transporter permease [Candidatus Acidoferrales bacterium]